MLTAYMYTGQHSQQMAQQTCSTTSTTATSTRLLLMEVNGERVYQAGLEAKMSSAPRSNFEHVTDLIKAVLLGREEDLAEIERVLVDFKIMRSVSKDNATRIRQQSASATYMIMSSFWVTAAVLELWYELHVSRSIHPPRDSTEVILELLALEHFACGIMVLGTRSAAVAINTVAPRWTWALALAADCTLFILMALIPCFWVAGLALWFIEPECCICEGGAW